MLYDQFGRGIQVRDTRRPETREIAIAEIRDRWNDYPSSGLTPQRLAAILREADQGDMRRQAELFEEMEEKDAHLASQFQVRKLAVQGLGWEILPAAEDARAKQIAEACREQINGLVNFDEHVLDLLDALPKGYSTLEILWDTSAGQAAIRDLRWVHSKKITYWESLTPRILTVEEQVRGIDPPPFKFVFHRYKARSGHDTRSGLMRVCAWMYLFKNYSIKDWVAFAEVYGMPLRVGRYEPGASKADKESLVAAIRSLGSDAAGIISKSTEIEFVEAQKSGGTSGRNIYESLAGFCDAQMSKAILGQTLTSEAGGTTGQGSYALGQVHNDVRQDLTEADSRALAKTITHQLLRPFVGFNFGWDAAVPAFRFLFEPPEDLKAAAETYKILSEIGFDMSQEHVSERFKIPVRKEGETPLSAPTKKQSPVPVPAKLLAKIAGGGGDPGQRFVDDLAEVLLSRDDATDPLLGQIVSIVQNADSYEDMLETLYAKYASLDSAKFETVLNQAMFAANLWGYLRAREEGRG